LNGQIHGIDQVTFLVVGLSHQGMIEKLPALNSNAIKPGADLAVDIPSIGHD
jgi:hypothetical protein